MKFLATKTFTKDDLEDGMVVEYANGERRLVLEKYLLGNDGCNLLEKYSENLDYISCPYSSVSEELRIDKVYSAHMNTLSKYFNDENLNLIWKREDPKKMTIEDIEDAIGYKLYIIEE